MKKTLPDESPLPQAGNMPARTLRLARPGIGRRRGQHSPAGQPQRQSAAASTSHPTLETARNPLPSASGAALLAGYNKAGNCGVTSTPGASAIASSLVPYPDVAWHNKLRNYSVEGGVPPVINGRAGCQPAHRNFQITPLDAGSRPLPAHRSCYPESVGLRLVA